MLTAKSGSAERVSLEWYDGKGAIVATDTKLVRRQGNDENHFEMPMLKIGEDEMDLLVACWLAKVWVEVVGAKKRTLRDGELTFTDALTF